MILEVEGGETVRPADIRDLRGTLEPENAELASFLGMGLRSRGPDVVHEANWRR